MDDILDIVKESCTDEIFDQNLQKRFPVGVDITTKNDSKICHICTEENCEKMLVYERHECLGKNCTKGQGAISWFCENCAVDLDMRSQMSKNETGVDNVKGNMMCRCPNGSPFKSTSFVVIRETGKVTAYELDREKSTGLMINGDKMFNKMPCMKEIICNPDILENHYKNSYMIVDGKIPLKETFNVSLNASIRKGGRVSTQFIFDTKKTKISVVASTEMSNFKTQYHSKLGPTKRQLRGGKEINNQSDSKAGTSSAGSITTRSDAGGENVICFEFPLIMEDIDKNQKIKLVCEGVMKPGEFGSGCLMQAVNKIENQSTLPTFCPIDKLDEIETSITTSLNDIENAKKFERMCQDEQNDLKFIIKNDKYFVDKIDTGTHKIFMPIPQSLEACGFGEKADRFDWHVLVFRVGRKFISIFVLVVHCPYPGMWVIVQRQNFSETIGDCHNNFLMNGMDLSPYSVVANINYKLIRGIWELSKMRMYLGFSEHSTALDKVLNRDENMTGTVLKMLIDNNIISMRSIEDTFNKQKNRITTENAKKDRNLNSKYVLDMLDCEEGTDLGDFGKLLVSFSMHEDIEDEEGETIKPEDIKVENDENGVPTFTVNVEICPIIRTFLRVANTIGSDENLIKKSFNTKACYYDDEQQETLEVADDLMWEAGVFDIQIPSPLSSGVPGEIMNYDVLRETDGKKIVSFCYVNTST